MKPSTVVTFSDVTGQPSAYVDLPTGIRLGERLLLSCLLRRLTGNGKRTEELHVSGEFRVREVVLDVNRHRQNISLESVGRVPTWKAVRNAHERPRRLPPAVSPRTVVV